MSKSKKTNNIRKVTISTLLVTLLSGYVNFSYGLDSNALPTGAVVAAGAAGVGVRGSVMTVTQASQNAILNWNSFDIGANAAVNFVQPNSSSVAMNRVLSANPSQIMGSLNANGVVFLVNPQGILVGQGAQVNVGSLVASTLNISDADFLAGHYSFVGGATKGSVVNQGTLTAAEHGFISLLGNKVVNEGLVSARLGSVAMAAGDQLNLSIDSAGLINVGVGKGALDALVQNSGALVADGGRVLLTAKSANDVLAQVVNNTGIVQAQTIGERDGQIWVLAADSLANTGVLGAAANSGAVQNAAGSVYLGGTLDVSSQGAGRAGDVTVAGTHVQIDGSINASATGTGAAGRVLVNTTQTMVLAGQGSIDVSSQSGAGSAVLWSEQLTEMHGRIDGAGKGANGHGAKLELSSDGALRVDGVLQIGAKDAAHSGSLLLDPATLDIGTDVSKTTLEAMTGSVVLTATGQITFDEGLDLNMQSSSLLIASQSTGGIEFLGSGDTVGSIATFGGSVTLTASGSGSLKNIGQIMTAGGDIRLSGVGVDLAKGVNAGTGNVTVSVFGGGITGTVAEDAGAITGQTVTLDATYGYIGTALHAVNVYTPQLVVNTGGSINIADRVGLHSLDLTANHFFGNDLSYAITAPNFVLHGADTQGGNSTYDPDGRYSSYVRWVDYTMSTPAGHTAPNTVNLTQDLNFMPESVNLPGTALHLTSVMGSILGGNVDPVVADSLVLRSPIAIGGLNYNGNINSHSWAGNDDDDGWALKTQVAGTIDARTLTPTGSVANTSIVSLSQFGEDLKGVASASFIDLIATGNIGSADTPFVMNFDGNPNNCIGYVSNHLISGGSMYLTANFNADQNMLNLFHVYADNGSIHAQVNALETSNEYALYVDSMVAQGGSINLTAHDTLSTNINLAAATGNITINNTGDTSGLVVSGAILYGADAPGRSITLNTENSDLYVEKLSTNGAIWNDFTGYAPNNRTFAPVSHVPQGSINLTAQHGSIYTGYAYCAGCTGSQHSGGYFVAGQLNMDVYTEIGMDGAAFDTSMAINANHSAGKGVGDIRIWGYGIDSFSEPWGEEAHSMHFAHIVNENGYGDANYYGDNTGVSLGNGYGDVRIGYLQSIASGCAANANIVAQGGGIFADGSMGGGRIEAAGTGARINLEASGSLGQRATGSSAAVPLSLNGDNIRLSSGGDVLVANDRFNVNQVILNLNNTNLSNIYSVVSGPVDGRSVDFHATSADYVVTIGGNASIGGTSLVYNDGDGVNSFTVYAQGGGILVNGTVSAPVTSSANYLALYAQDGDLTISGGSSSYPGLKLTGGEFYGEANNVTIGKILADNSYIYIYAYNNITVDRIESGIGADSLGISTGAPSVGTDIYLEVDSGSIAVNHIAVNGQWDGGGVQIYANTTIDVNELWVDHSYVDMYAGRDISVIDLSSGVTRNGGAVNTNVYIRSNNGSVIAQNIHTDGGSIELRANGSGSENGSPQPSGILFETVQAEHSTLTMRAMGGDIVAMDHGNLAAAHDMELVNRYGAIGSAGLKLNLSVENSLTLDNQPVTFHQRGGGAIQLITNNDPSSLTLLLSTPDAALGGTYNEFSITPSANSNANGFTLLGSASYVLSAPSAITISSMGMGAAGNAPAISITADAESVHINSSGAYPVGYTLNFGQNVSSTDLQLSGSLGQLVTLNWNNSTSTVRTITGVLDIDRLQFNTTNSINENYLNLSLDLNRPLLELGLQFDAGSSTAGGGQDAIAFQKRDSVHWGVGADQSALAYFGLNGSYAADIVTLDHLTSTSRLSFAADVLPNIPMVVGAVSLGRGGPQASTLRLNAEKITSASGQSITADSVTLSALRDAQSVIGDSVNPLNVVASSVTLAAASDVYMTLDGSVLTKLDMTVAHPIFAPDANVPLTVKVAGNTYQILNSQGGPAIVSLVDSASNLSSTLAVPVSFLNTFKFTSDFALNVGAITVSGANSLVSLTTRNTSDLMPNYGTAFDFANFLGYNNSSRNGWDLTDFASSGADARRPIGIFDDSGSSLISADTVTLKAKGYQGAVGTSGAALNVATPNLVIETHGDLNVADASNLQTLDLTIAHDRESYQGQRVGGKTYAITDATDLSLVIRDFNSDDWYRHIQVVNVSSSNLTDFSFKVPNADIDITLGGVYNSGIGYVNGSINLPMSNVTLDSARHINTVYQGAMSDSTGSVSTDQLAIAADTLKLVAAYNIDYGFGVGVDDNGGLRIQTNSLRVEAGGSAYLANLGSVNVVKAHAGNTFWLRALANGGQADITNNFAEPIDSPTVRLVALYGDLGTGPGGTNIALSTRTHDLTLRGGGDMNIVNNGTLTDLTIDSAHNKPVLSGVTTSAGQNSITVNDTVAAENGTRLQLAITDLYTPSPMGSIADNYQFQVDGLNQPALSFMFIGDSGINLGTLTAGNIEMHSRYGDILQTIGQTPTLTADAVYLGVSQDHSIGSQAHPIHMVTPEIGIRTGGDFFGTDTLDVNSLDFEVHQVQQIDRGDGAGWRDPIYSFDNSAAPHPVVFDLVADTTGIYGNGMLRVNRLELPNLATVDDPDASASVTIATWGYTPSDIGVGRIYAPGSSGQISFSTANNIVQLAAPSGAQAGLVARTISFDQYADGASIGTAQTPVLFDTAQLNILHRNSNDSEPTGIFLTQVGSPSNTLQGVSITLDQVYSDMVLGIHAANFDLAAAANGFGDFSLLTVNALDLAHPVNLSFQTDSTFNIGQLDMGLGELNLTSNYGSIYADLLQDPMAVNIRSQANVSLIAADNIGTLSTPILTDIAAGEIDGDLTGLLWVNAHHGDAFIWQTSTVHDLYLGQAQDQYSTGALFVESDAGLYATGPLTGGGALWLSAANDLNVFDLYSYQSFVEVHSVAGSVHIDGGIYGANQVTVQADQSISVGAIGNYYNSGVSVGYQSGPVTGGISLHAHVGNVDLHGQLNSLIGGVEVNAGGNITYYGESSGFGVTPSITLAAGGSIGVSGGGSWYLNDFKAGWNNSIARPDTLVLDVTAGSGSLDLLSYADVTVNHLSAANDVRLRVHGDYVSPNAGIYIGAIPMGESSTISSANGSVSLYTQSGNISGDAGNKIVAADTISLFADQPLYINNRGAGLNFTLSDVYHIGTPVNPLALDAPHIALTANGDIYATVPTTGVSSIEVSRTYVAADYNNIGTDFSDSNTRSAWASAFTASLTQMPVGTVSIVDTANSTVVSIADGGVSGQSVLYVDYGTPISFSYQSINNISIGSINLSGTGSGTRGALSLGVTNPYDLTIGMGQGGGTVVGGQFTFNMTPVTDYSTPLQNGSGDYYYAGPVGSFGTPLTPINTQVTGISGNILGENSTFYVNQFGALTVTGLSAGGGIGIAAAGGDLTVLGTVSSDHGPVALWVTAGDLVLDARAGNVSVSAHGALDLRATQNHIKALHGAVDPDTLAAASSVSLSGDSLYLNANALELPYTHITATGVSGPGLSGVYSNTTIDLAHANVNTGSNALQITAIDGNIDLTSATVVGGQVTMNAGIWGGTGTLLTTHSDLYGDFMGLYTTGHDLDLSQVTSVNAGYLDVYADGVITLGNVRAGVEMSVASASSIQGSTNSQAGIGAPAMYLSAATGIGTVTPVLVKTSYDATLNAYSTAGDVNLVTGNADSRWSTLTTNAALSAGSLDIKNYYGTLNLSALDVTGDENAGNFGNVSATNMFVAGHINLSSVTANTAGALVAITALGGAIVDTYANQSTGIAASRIVLNALGQDGYIGSYSASDNAGRGVRVDADAVLAVSGGDVVLNSKRFSDTVMPLVASTSNSTIEIYSAGNFIVSQIATQPEGSVNIRAQGNILDDGKSTTRISTGNTDLYASGSIGASDVPVSMVTSYLHAVADIGDATLAVQGSVALVSSNSASGTFTLLADGDINVGTGQWAQSNWNTAGSVGAGTAINLISTGGRILDNTGWGWGWHDGYDTLVAPVVTLSAYGDIGDHLVYNAPMFLGTGQMTASSQTGSISLYNNSNSSTNGFSTAGVTLNAPLGDVYVSSYRADLLMTGANSAQGTYRMDVLGGAILQAGGNTNPITAGTVNLYADHDIGSSGTPVLVSTTFLTAWSDAGDAFINAIGDVRLLGDSWAGGNFNLSSVGGSISGAHDSWVTADNVVLSADHNIGSVDNPVWFTANTGLTTTASGNDGTNGDVYLGTRNNVTLTGTLSALGTYGLTVLEGSIIQGQGGLISANGAYLKADGSVGTLDHRVQTHVNSLTAQALDGDVWVTNDQSVTLVGNSSATSTFSLAALSGSMSGAEGSKISANVVYLWADGDIGSSAAPVQLSADHLSAYAYGGPSYGVGDAYLSNDKTVMLVANNFAQGTYSLRTTAGDIVLGDVSSDYQGGNVNAGVAINLRAAGSIVDNSYGPGQGTPYTPVAVLVAPSITLKADTGDVGNSDSGPVSVLATNLSVDAGGSAFVYSNYNESPADLIVSLVARAGSVALETSGDIYLQDQSDNSATSSYSLRAHEGSIYNDPTTITAHDVLLHADGFVGTPMSPILVNATNVTIQADSGSSYVQATGTVNIAGANQAAQTFSLVSDGGSIYAADGASITASDVSLQASAHIGAAQAPIQLATSSVSALAGTGDVYLANSGMDIAVSYANGAHGTYSLAETGGSITNGTDGLITAADLVLYADQSIGAQGSPVQVSAINVTIYADAGSSYVRATGTVNIAGANQAGQTFSLVSNGGSIFAANGASVTASDVNLQASAHIGTAQAPIQLATSSVSALAGTGDVYLANSGMDIAVSYANGAHGTYSLAETGGSIMNGTDGLITADTLVLSSDGAIGSNSLALATAVSHVTASAADGSIYIANTSNQVNIDSLTSSDKVVFRSTADIVFGESAQSTGPQIVAPTSVRVLSDSGDITTAFKSSLAHANVKTGNTPSKDDLAVNATLVGAADISAPLGHVGSSDRPIWVADFSHTVDNYNYTTTLSNGTIQTAANGLNMDGGSAWINTASVSTTYPSMPVIDGVSEYTVKTVLSERQAVPSITFALPIIPVGGVVQVSAPMVVTVSSLGLAMPKSVVAEALKQDANFSTQSDPLLGGNATEVGRAAEDNAITEKKKKKQQVELQQQ